jgi:hypothetical protein
MDKKVWHVPQLIVLAQGQSEEAVLASCKNGPGGTSCPQEFGGSCVVSSACNVCYMLSPS